MAEEVDVAATGWSPVPARGYSWPPFEDGNTASLRHGAFSERTWQPVAAQLLQGAIEAYPDLGRFPELLVAWSDAEARAELLRQHLDEVGMFDEDGAPRRGPLAWLERFSAAAAKLREQLGLTPRSEAELARLRAEATRSIADLDGLAAAGAQSLAARKAVDTAATS